MDNKVRLTREEKTLDEFSRITWQNLMSYFIQANPGKTVEDFTAEFYTPLWSNDAATGDNILEELRAAQTADESANFKYAPMLLSAAYCIESLKARDRNERERAWSCMADARYWCGVLLSSKGIEQARDITIDATRKDTAKQGGTVRAERKYKEIKEEAFRLAREKRPAQKGWHSRRQAALAIQEEVKEFAKSKGQAMSPEQAMTTIYGWLKEMPDAGTLFPNKQQAEQKAISDHPI